MRYTFGEERKLRECDGVHLDRWMREVMITREVILGVFVLKSMQGVVGF